MKLSKEQMYRELYFPTSTFRFELPDAQEINEELLELIYEERERDQDGIQRSNFKGLGGWHSHNDLHKDSNYDRITNAIHQAASLVSESEGYHGEYDLKIGTMWSIINPPGSSNQAHIHPGCQWSGVYYIQAPEDSGNIVFTDPRTENLMHQPRYQPKRTRPKHCWTKVNFTPTAGKMIIFPSWLYHSVLPNLSQEEAPASNRVIISFNLSQVRKKTNG